MHYQSNGHHRYQSESMSLDDELKDLEIDGYKTKFVRRVVLLPAELIESDYEDGKPNE